MTFQDLGLQQRISAALAAQGIVEPTAIQAKAIPAALRGGNLLAESETGSGKTFAFLAPLLQAIDASRPFCQALILSPTRELASQTHRVLERLIGGAGLRIPCALILGGASVHRQLGELSAKPRIVVGTTGRLLQLSQSGDLDLSRVRIAVLDEADRLLSRDAREETVALMAALPSERSTWLYSATLGPATVQAAEPLAPGAEIIRDESREVLSSLIEHWCFLSDDREKLDLVRKFDNAVKPERALLFVRSSGDVLNALLRLSEAGLPVEAIHGDFDDQKRRESMERFRSGKSRWLITSDLGARGLDIEAVSHVVMLDAPEDERAYVHRAGRTGRNGRNGVCAAIADPFELKRLSRIAVGLGVSFKAKRLYAGEVYDVTLEEFFGFAEKMESDRRRRRAEKRHQEAPSGAQGREPGEGRGSGERGDHGAGRRPRRGHDGSSDRN